MSQIEKLFNKIDSDVEKLKKENNKSYFENLAAYLDFPEDEKYFEILDNYTKDEIIKTYQFLVLKSFKELQNINYNVTPEIIAQYLTSFIEIVFEKEASLNILDLASGSGNIFLKIKSELKKNMTLTSVDIDATYVRLQKNIYNLIELESNILNQDALKPINIPFQDIVVSDVPNGYYGDEDNSLNYKLCSDEGLSLNALLFLEQAVNLLKPNGVALLVLPKQIMELTGKLKNVLEKDLNLNAFILLPEELFKNKDQQKVIVLATRKEQTILPKKVFLAELPSYQNKGGYLSFLKTFRNWLDSNE